MFLSWKWSYTREVLDELFQLFIDALAGLNSRLPKSLFVLKAKKVQEDWLQQHPDTPEEDKFRFSNQRVKDYLKNIWNLRYYFIKKFGVDPPVTNGDQIPLHRNDSSRQATLNFKYNKIFVQQNPSFVERMCHCVFSNCTKC